MLVEENPIVRLVSRVESTRILVVFLDAAFRNHGVQIVQLHSYVMEKRYNALFMDRHA